MSKTAYLDLMDINVLQQNIMIYVQDWAREKKTPIPQKDIILGMKKAGTKVCTTINALNSLLRKGYIRRACTMTNRTYYVQLRSL